VDQNDESSKKLAKDDESGETMKGDTPSTPFIKRGVKRSKEKLRETDPLGDASVGL
jgi:hypothetical protein